MQWILSDFEDTPKLVDALERMGLDYSVHKVVPIFGIMDPVPVVKDPARAVMFGAYSMHRHATEFGISPGVFTLRPFVHEKVWEPHLLNSATGSTFVKVRDVAENIADDDSLYFVRPVEDSKEIAGAVMDAAEIRAMAEGVMALEASELVKGSLEHDTELMLTEPVRILSEWRVWVVGEKVVTWSLYKAGSRVLYRAEIDDDALAFVTAMVALNPGYAQAYVVDVCRTEEGMRILETNCINAAGFYAGDLQKIVAAVDALAP